MFYHEQNSTFSAVHFTPASIIHQLNLFKNQHWVEFAVEAQSISLKLNTDSLSRGWREAQLQCHKQSDRAEINVS